MVKAVQFIIVGCLLFLAFVPGNAFERFDVVSTEELKTILQARQRGETDFVLVNTLDEIIYKDKNIPGSINIPWSQIDSRYKELGEDKDKLIITYCIGHR